MKPFVHALFVAGLATTTALGAQALSVQSARLPTPPVLFDHEGEPSLPPPVTGDELFTVSGGDAGASESCMPVAQILGVFALDVEAVGGEILALSGGLEQEFADQWRLTVGMTPVDVSQVYAHVVPAEDGDAIVDVVEVDGEGCALSRTLLSHNDWLELLGAIGGVEV
jgi:hypothetical protein